MELDICSHDAPEQKPGTSCIRCGKLLPGEAPKEETPKEVVVRKPFEAFSEPKLPSEEE